MAVFKNILVLAESINTSVPAMERAIELSDAARTTIHLVKLVPAGSPFQTLLSLFKMDSKETLREKRLAGKKELTLLKKQMLQDHPCYRIVCHVFIERFFKKRLRRFLQVVKTDLIIIAGSNQGINDIPTQVFYNRLSKRTGVPVLNVFDDADGNCSRSILHRSLLFQVPVMVAEKNIQSALEIAKKMGAHIYLVTVLNENKEDMKQRVDAFYFAYKMLCEYGHVPQYKILSAATLLSDYAKQVKTKMLLLDGGQDKTLLHSLKQKMASVIHPLPVIDTAQLKPAFK
jgi:hypothetical protein